MQKTPFTIAADAATARGERDLARRITTEGKIARKIVESIFANGLRVGVNDGEETVLKDSDSLDAAMQAMFSTDADYIYAYKDGKRVGTVFLVYGNDGNDVVNDYSTSLELVMQPVNNYADTL